jgi:hypothetical protein
MAPADVELPCPPFPISIGISEGGFELNLLKILAFWDSVNF